MRKLIVPTINNNGNTASDLIDKLKAVNTSVNALEDALRSASDIFHGRNFQTEQNGQELQRQAMAAWHERLLAVHDMGKDIIELALRIQEQGRK